MSNIQLSKRLNAACEMVNIHSRVADVGTDHGFVPIYLMENNIADHVVAMDVNEGPLERATEHVREHGFEGRIEIRLSDGLEKLSEGEADTLICCGMGGLLMMRILEEGRPKEKGITHMILQPQSDLFGFRKYLYENHFLIEEEREIFEDGKYYTAMKAGTSDNIEDPYEKAFEAFCKKVEMDKERALTICHRFGPTLILKTDEVLKQYLEHELELCDKIILKLSENEHSDRMRDIINKKNDISFVLSLFD